MKTSIHVDSVWKNRHIIENGKILIHPVLRGVNLAIDHGEHLALVGPSGGGKSTLLRLFNRLEDPDEGQVLLDNTDVRDIPVLDLRRRLVLVPQKPLLFDGSVLWNIQYVDRINGREPVSEEAALRLLKIVELEAGLLHREAKHLSVGQQQRVCLARSLKLKPEVLLLDETTSSIDPPVASQVLANLNEIRKQWQCIIIHVTHELNKSRLADRIAFMQEGRILEVGSPHEFLTSPHTSEGKAFIHTEYTG